MYGVHAMQLRLAVAWKCAVEKKDGPTLSDLLASGPGPSGREVMHRIADIAKGGYVLVDCDGTPDAIVIATGSEVDLAVKAAAASDKKVRVVSMPKHLCF